MSPILVTPLVALTIGFPWSPRESSAQQTTSASPDLSTANPTRQDFAKKTRDRGPEQLK